MSALRPPARSPLGGVALFACAALLACVPSPRGHCSTDADCAGGPPGLFCAESVCQAPPTVRLEVPTTIGTRDQTAVVRAHVDRAHGGVEKATGTLSAGGTTITGSQETPGVLRFDVPLALAQAGTEGNLGLTVIVSDDMNHGTSSQGALLFDDAAPQITSAISTAWNARAAIKLTATITDMSLNTASINLSINNKAALGPTHSDGSLFEFDIPKEAFPSGTEGPVQLQFTAADTFGHVRTLTQSILIDDKAPEISIDPATVPTLVIRGQRLSLSVAVIDASPTTLSVEVNGVPLGSQIVSNGKPTQLTIDSSVTLPNASKLLIRVMATDEVGNQTPVVLTVQLTRVRWTNTTAGSTPAVGLALGVQELFLTLDSTVIVAVARDSGLGRSITVGSTTTTFGQPATDGISIYYRRSDSNICKAGANDWCCGPLGTLDSEIALPVLPSLQGPIPTVVVGSSGVPSKGGQRVYAIRDGDNNTCEMHPSSAVVDFTSSTAGIAADGTAFLSTTEAIVAAQFDGLAWTTSLFSRPGKSYRGPTALAAPLATGQPVLASTIVGLVEEIVFPPGGSGGLPGQPLPSGTAGFSTEVTDTAYGASGATIAEDGTIVVGTEDRRLVALDAAGRVRWTLPLGGRPGGPPTQGAGNIAYAVDESGTVTAVNVTDGSVRWTFAASASLRVPPALGCDGTLYVAADDGTVYALVSDSAGLASSAWPRVGRDNRGTGDARRSLRGADGSCLE